MTNVEQTAAIRVFSFGFRHSFVIGHSNFGILSIRVHSWLKGESQHLDRGRDFDVLIANDEIQRSIARLFRSCRLGPRRVWFSGLFARRTFVLFIVHVQRANDEKLPTRTCDLIQDFSRRSRRCFKRNVDNVALQQCRGSRARLPRLCRLCSAG